MPLPAPPSTSDRPDPRAALTSRWHAAAVAGPDAGWCVPLGRSPATIGRAPGSGLRLDDPRVSRHHLELRVRRGHVVARDLGSTNGTWRLPRRGGTRRRLRGRWRRLRVGTRLGLGAGQVVVRLRPGLAGAAPSSRPRREAPRSGLLPAVLAVAGTLPLLALTGSGVPRGVGVGALVLAVVATPLLGLTRRAPVADAGPPHRVFADPAAVLLAAVAGAPPSPAQGRVEVVVAGERLDLLADGPVAMVGTPDAVRASARWLLGATAVGRGPQGVIVRSPDSARWACAARLARPAPATPTLEVVDLLDPVPTARIPGAATTTTLVLVPTLAAVPPPCRRVIEVGPTAVVGVGEEWLAAVTEALATGPGRGPSLPEDVPATDLLADAQEAWPAADDGLRAAFAVTETGPLEVDLARDGPHALVAGTTGSGKSELLTTWLLALATRYPPSALVLVAVDYKGGSAFGPLARLPHVAGVLTDLDPTGTSRALDALRDELARREHILAESGARDLADHHARRPAGPRLPRVLVVVDEFRVLADEHPELLAALVRVAAQGRSLGLHLVLATQRPAGAVTADMRANLSVAVCLRVLTVGDSLDVLGSPAAASLPPVPGRALVSGVAPPGAPPAGAAPVLVQAGWAGAGAAGVERAVAVIRRAATDLGELAATPLWAPPLPAAVSAEPVGTAPAVDPALPLVLLDRRGRRDLTPWAWDPGTGPLLIAGPAGSGRTTALLTLALGALGRGIATHLVGLPETVTDAWDQPPTALGTVVGPQDPRRLARLLDLLLRGTTPALVCLDGAEAVAAACDLLLGPGAGIDRLAALVRSGPAGVAVAASADLPALGARWAAPVRQRLVLGALDPVEASLAGIPSALRGRAWPPGRGVLLGRGLATLGQVMLPPPPPGAATRGPARPGLRLQPLPLDVAAVAVAPPTPGGDEPGLVLGVGGDDAGPVAVPAGPGARVVIAGPAESGRTSALRRLAATARAAGEPVTWVDGADPGPDAPHALMASGLLAVDDVDALPRELADRLARRWGEPRGAVLATARSSSLALGLHGALGCLREARTAVVLAPLQGGPAHLASAEVLPHADPTYPRHPGRGVLVEPRRTLPVQVARPG